MIPESVQAWADAFERALAEDRAEDADQLQALRLAMGRTPREQLAWLLDAFLYRELRAATKAR